MVLLAGAPLRVAGAQPASRDRDAIGVAAEGYQANREAFSSIRCRHVVTKTSTRSVEDALRGSFVGDPLVFDCLWLVHGAKVRYEKVCRSAPKDLAPLIEAARKEQDRTQADSGGAKSKKFSFSVPCANSGVLRNGSYGLAYTPDTAQGANLFPPDQEDGYGVRMTPFDMDIMGGDETGNPARVLKDCLEGRYSGSFDGTEKVLGVDALAFTARFTSDLGKPPSIGKVAYRLLFDPRRGYLPIHMSGGDWETGEKRYETYMTHVRACSRDRWFPERCVVVSGFSGKGPHSCTEVKVVELDVDNPPPDEEFCTVLGAGASVSVRNRREFFTLQADEKVMATDLERLHQRCIEGGKKYAEEEALAKRAGLAKWAEPDLVPHNRLRWLLTAGVGCALAAAVVWSLSRWRRRKAR
jgi:hypothetical protein